MWPKNKWGAHAPLKVCARPAQHYYSLYMQHDCIASSARTTEHNVTRAEDSACDERALKQG